MRYVTMLALAAAVTAAAPRGAQQSPTLPGVLDRLGSYLADYAARLPATIATENYEQRSGFGRRSDERVVLVSEFGIMQLDGGGWLGLRDVVSVNGKSVPDRGQRLQDIFRNPSPRTLQQARRIAQENARFNIGSIQRTINDPAVVLELLDARNRSRMRFTKTGETTINGDPAWAVRFDERRWPTIIHTSAGVDEPVRGTAWIDPLTGRLLRAEISIDAATIRIGSITQEGFTATIDVVFNDEPRLGFWVPSKMTERYEARNLSFSSGEATYSNYRTFGVETRIVTPP